MIRKMKLTQRSSVGRDTALASLLPVALNNEDTKAKVSGSASEQILLYFLALPACLGKLVGVIGMQASAGGLDEPGPKLVAQSTTAPLCPQNLA